MRAVEGGRRCETEVVAGTVPLEHPFVAACRHPSLRLVGDPIDQATGRAFLDPATAQAAVDGLDLLVVHFGFEWQDADRLREALEEVRGSGVALVVVVHDLENPHLSDQRGHRARLSALLGAADAVLTLTSGVAAELRSQWRKPVDVLAHPTLLEAMPPPQPCGFLRRAGLHLKTLRANVRAHDALSAVDLAVRRPGQHGDVLVDDDVTALHHPRHDPAALERLVRMGAGPRVSTAVTTRLDNGSLHRWLVRQHALLLPYGWGTHSGWIELCKDLGVHAVAPTGGGYAEQGSAFTFDRDAEGPAAMAAALSRAMSAPRATPADRHTRLAQRDAAAEVLLEACRAAVSRRRGLSPHPGRSPAHAGSGPTRSGRPT